jgi:putative polyhydroxyalkanoate system protein
MSQIVVQRPHQLSLPQARRLAEKIARRLRSDYGGSYSWDGDTLRFKRTGASGQVAVTSDDFQICVDIGLLLTPLHARLEREIHAFVDAHFTTTELPQPARSASRRRAAPRSSRSHGASRSVRPN